MNNNEYIQQALEKALVDIQYWQNWREILSRLCHDLSERWDAGRETDVKQAIDVLTTNIYRKEAEAWNHSFMWALGQSDETRRKIFTKAKERFLISDREHFSYEIMSHLDPRALVENVDHEEKFREAIREYFKLEPQKENIKDESIP